MCKLLLETRDYLVKFSVLLCKLGALAIKAKNKKNEIDYPNKIAVINTLEVFSWDKSVLLLMGKLLKNF